MCQTRCLTHVANGAQMNVNVVNKQLDAMVCSTPLRKNPISLRRQIDTVNHQTTRHQSWIMGTHQWYFSTWARLKRHAEFNVAFRTVTETQISLKTNADVLALSNSKDTSQFGSVSKRIQCCPQHCHTEPSISHKKIKCHSTNSCNPKTFLENNLEETCLPLNILPPPTQLL